MFKTLYLFSQKICFRLEYYRMKLYGAIIRHSFKKCGKGVLFDGFTRLVGNQFISIGEKTKIGKYAVLTAYEKVGTATFCPVIVIGSNCNIGQYSHITCINKIEIGNNVLTGRNVTITDNSHGNVSKEDLFLPPLKRKTVSKGPVIIGDRVWIGDKVTILPNVIIGEGCIIGANAVVTKNVPPYCVVGGNPARVIKNLNEATV